MPRQTKSDDINVDGVITRVLGLALGPWPIRPVLLAVLYGFINQYAVVRIAESQDVGIPQATITELPSTLAQAVAVFVATWVGRRFQKRMDPKGVRRSVYVVCLVIADAIFTVLRLLILGNDHGGQVGVIAIRDLLAMFIVTALFGIAGERLATQVARTQEALELVETQRAQLLIADEEARQQVARYLHDNVQADLVVLAMQLRNQATNMPDLDRERINSVVDELDKVRLLDIRTASRRLNPDIESLGLSAALRELAAGYAPAMTVSIECPYEFRAAASDRLLAMYRIVEQALLNAATHGKAATCAVNVVEDDSGAIRLCVENDGEPITAAMRMGGGTAIIEAWVSRFSGDWKLATEGNRTHLFVRIETPS